MYFDFSSTFNLVAVFSLEVVYVIPTTISTCTARANSGAAVHHSIVNSKYDKRLKNL